MNKIVSSFLLLIEDWDYKDILENMITVETDNLAKDGNII
jgi:hypothetical protein